MQRVMSDDDLIAVMTPDMSPSQITRFRAWTTKPIEWDFAVEQLGVGPRWAESVADRGRPRAFIRRLFRLSSLV